jgi:rubrerythrin
MAMETKFNVFEILEIAERIEHRGATFYVKMAELFTNPDRKDIFYKLANWKAKHEKLWIHMRKRFSEKTGEFGTFDPDNYILSNPEVMAGLTWFGTKRSGGRALTGKESKEEIIRDAIKRANEVIIFYQGLKDFARDPASEDTIDKIIKEENQQIRLLMEELEKL